MFSKASKGKGGRKYPFVGAKGKGGKGKFAKGKGGKYGGKRAPFNGLNNINNVKKSAILGGMRALGIRTQGIPEEEHEQEVKEPKDSQPEDHNPTNPLFESLKDLVDDDGSEEPIEQGYGSFFGNEGRRKKRSNLQEFDNEEDLLNLENDYEVIDQPQQEESPEYEEYDFSEEDYENPFQQQNNAQLRIQGGFEVTKGTWPWMGQLFDDDHLLCGLSLICTNWVLTAAHCFYVPKSGYMRLEASRYRVRLGRSHRKGSVDEAGSQNFIPNRIFVHPAYSAAMNLHDIALIALPNAARISDFVRPICLPAALKFNKQMNVLTTNGHGQFEKHYRSQKDQAAQNVFSSSDSESGKYCWIAGWGRDKQGEIPTNMQHTTIKMRSIDTCQKLYMYFFPQAQMCAGGHDERDSCVGDSGGPLMCDSSDHNNRDPEVYDKETGSYRKVWTVQGVTSFGSDCGTYGKPGGYTRINYYTTWIEKIVGKGCSKTYRDHYKEQEYFQAA